MTHREYTPDRRPIASRERAVAKWMCDRLVQLGVSPNSISILGMIAGVLAGGAFAATADPDHAAVWFFAAAVLMQLRLLANMLDGMVAVQTGNASPVGELYNEIPDRVADACTMIGAGYAIGSQPQLGYVAACLAVFLAYLRAQGKVAGAHQEFCGPFAKPQRVFFLTLAAVVCGAIAAVSADSVAAWKWMTWALGVLIVGELWTVGRRLNRISAALQSE